MGDMTIEYMQMCGSIDGPKSFNIRGYEQHGLFSERSTPACSCPAYKFCKVADGQARVCKHLRQIESEACHWHQQYSMELQEEPGRCPRCGGETVTVRVAV